MVALAAGTSSESRTGRGFAVCAFFGRAQGEDKIGPNGLPLPPSSIKIIGRFQKLRRLRHENLCAYVDIMRANTGCVLLTSEHYRNSLSNGIKDLTSSERLNCCLQLASAVQFLHTNHITVGRMSLQQVTLPDTRPISIKLSNYGILYATEQGEHVDFIIPNLYTCAPEILLSVLPGQLGESPGINKMCSAAADVWALGIIMLEICLALQFEQIWKKKQLLGILLTTLQRGTSSSAYEPLMAALLLQSSTAKVPEELACVVPIIRSCLNLLPNQRPSVESVHSQLRSLRPAASEVPRPPVNANIQDLLAFYRSHSDWLTHPLDELPVEQLFVLWRLCGSDPETFLLRRGLIKLSPPVTTMPCIAVGECEVFGNEQSRVHSLHLDLFPLCSNHVYEQASKQPATAFLQLLEPRYANDERGQPVKKSADLPLTVKERSLTYQLERMILFDRLLTACPYKVDWLRRESLRDIPPLFRAQVWRFLLDVNEDVAREKYEALDTVSPTVSDKQLEVDIPRCHQYDELLCSPVAHAKFMRLLKAWIITQPQYVYWQGLDSLTAPFLYLNFAEEHRALAGLTTFIDRYLHGFFLKDNSAVIHEYLAVFSAVITFHEPALSQHLQDIEFAPNLYAFPWFLTMFSHVMPLYKLVHLWDSLLLRCSGFPLVVGVAVLRQQRARLMEYGFNECILHFSDLPGIEIERCVADAVEMYARTPSSVLHRIHKSSYRPALFTDGDSSDFLAAVPSDVPLDVPDVPLSELCLLPCCRLSVRDYLLLSRHADDQQQSDDNRLLTIDVRPIELFHRYSLPGSVNVPLALRPDECVTEQVLSQCPSAAQLIQRVKHQAVLVIVAGQGVTSVHVHQFASLLISQSHSRVCLLTATVETLKRCLAFL